jgi:hypothetical protein
LRLPRKTRAVSQAQGRQMTPGCMETHRSRRPHATTLTTPREILAACFGMDGPPAGPLEPPEADFDAMVLPEEVAVDRVWGRSTRARSTRGRSTGWGDDGVAGAGGIGQNLIRAIIAALAGRLDHASRSLGRRSCSEQVSFRVIHASGESSFGDHAPEHVHADRKRSA